MANVTNLKIVLKNKMVQVLSQLGVHAIREVISVAIRIALIHLIWEQAVTSEDSKLVAFLTISVKT